MSFLITRDQPDGKLYLRRDADGELLWTPSKDSATRFPDDEAEIIADQMNRYASVEAVVVGAGRAA